MHMRPRPSQGPILEAGLTPRACAEALRQRLAPQRWPVAPSELPSDAVLVGGAVRDAALGRLAERPDLDLVVSGGAIPLGRQLARRHGGTCVVLDAGRDIARLVLPGWTVDLARREGADLAADLGRRDYTVNAIALPLASGAAVVDPTGGLEHLRRRQLVAVSEANLLDDPLRLLRGVRLAAELEFSLCEPGLGWIRRHGERLAPVAGERVLAELERLATAPQGHRGLQQAWELGLVTAAAACPAPGVEAAQLSPTWAEGQGLTQEEWAGALPIARLAWLLPAAAGARLKGSRRLQQRCTHLRRWWQTLAHTPLTSLPEAERLELQEQLRDDLPALLLSQPPPTAQAALVRWRDPADPLFHPRPPLDGGQLQRALGLRPGPELGELLSHLKREQAFGRIPRHDAEAALAAAHRWLAARQPVA